MTDCIDLDHNATTPIAPTVVAAMKPFVGVNVAAIVGMGEASQIARTKAKEEQPRLRAVSDEFRDALMAALPSAQLNGDPTERLAGNLSFSVNDIEPLALMCRLRGRVSFLGLERVLHRQDRNVAC